MQSTIPDSVLQRQRVAFYVALAHILWIVSFVGVRWYFSARELPFNDRLFVLHPNTLAMIPLWAICWIVACVLVGNSISASKRVTTYAVGTLVLLSITGLPVAVTVWTAFQTFLSN